MQNYASSCEEEKDNLVYYYGEHTVRLNLRWNTVFPLQMTIHRYESLASMCLNLKV